MKTTLTFLIAFALTFISSAQEPCDGGRYSTNLFPAVSTTNDVVYGSNVEVFGSTQTLLLDVYEPTGDTETERPLIIWVHGGSFIGGSKTDGDVVALSNDFAEKGFVCASIDYRVGMWPIDSTNSIKALLRAVHDLKAAVRFFYQDKATTNTFKIDTTKIFIGGTSAGAITSLHMEYLDKVCEAEEYLTPATLTSMGGIEGTSGNPGYSSDVIGVINICGALARYGYIEPGDVPFCSLHGNNDAIVPYNRGIASVSGFDIMYLDGSRMLYEQAQDIGVSNNFFSYYGQDHVPHAGSAQYMDTTINFVRDFVIDVMGCTDSAIQPDNAPLENSTLYQLYYCDLGVQNDNENVLNSIYPNPVKDILSIEMRNGGNHVIQLIDLSGRIVRSLKSTNNIIKFNVEGIQSGSYVLQVTDQFGGSQSSNIIVE